MKLMERQIELAGATLNVASTSTSGHSASATSPGLAAPLLMLHGVTRRWQTFKPLIGSLSAIRPLHLLDFRGHGRSQPRPGEYRVVDYAADPVALIQTQIQQPVIVYGHSLGAMAAALVAAELHEKVAAVVLEDPPMHTMGERIGESMLLGYFSAMHRLAGDHRSVSKLASELAETTFHDPQSNTSIRLGDIRDAVALRFAASCLKQLDPTVFDSIIASQWLSGFDIEATLQKIRCPVLLLQADPLAGGMLTDADAEQIERLANDVSRIKMSACGHTIHSARTADLLSHLHAFLESLDET